MSDAWLEGRSKPYVGKRFDLNGSEATVGRSLGNTIVIGGHTVSNNHARLTTVAGEWHIQDIGSVNGTFINGKKLATLQKISAGDKLQFGKVELLFNMPGTASANGDNLSK